MKSRLRRINLEICEPRLALTSTASVFVPHRVLEDEHTLGAEFADIDGDGDDDIVVEIGSNENDRSIVWIENVAGVFSRVPKKVADAIPQARGVGDVTVDDVDGDGDLDVLLSAYVDYGDTAYQHTHWFENLDGDGTFSDPIFVADASYTTIRVADLNDDGTPEIVGAFNVVHVLQSDGDGKYQLVQSLDTGPELGGWTPRTLEIADLDNDGDLDVAFAGDGVFVLYNEGGVLQSAVSVLEFDGITLFDRLIAADIDNDGLSDLLYSRRLSTTVIRQRADSTFSIDEVLNTGSPRSIAFDVDCDFDLDFVTWQLGSITWYENESGAFAEPESLLETELRGIEWVDDSDIDRDGDVDILFTTNDLNRGRQVTVLATRVIGDSDDNGVFDSSDLVAVFQTGEYEDAVENNSTFDDGDWNGDGDFNSSDLVYAFQKGGYVE